MSPFVGTNLEAILLLLNQLNDKQAVVSRDGKFVATAHILIKTKEGNTIKAGRHYRPQNNDTFIGISYIDGDIGRPTILYPTDISKINKVFTLTISNKGESK